MRRLLFVLLTLIGHNARAGAFIKEFVEVRPGQRLWVEYRQSEHGKPTLFLLNGLTYSTTQWQAFVSALDQLDPDLGIVLYDMEGMGQTLLDKAPINFDIPFKSQLKDLKDLYTTLDIPGPKILAGLSYGGGMVLNYLSLYPNDFDKAIAISPFLAPLEAQDNYLKGLVRAYRFTMRFDPRTDDDIYNFYLRQLIYGTYYQAEPIVLENSYKLEGIYRMVKGSKNWNVANVINRFPPDKLNLVVGDKDEYIAVKIQQDFWSHLPPASKGSLLIIKDAPHKIPEAVPNFLAKWVMQIVKGNPALKRGSVFSGDSVRGQADDGKVVIPLLSTKAIDCAPFLQKTGESL